MTGRRIAGIVFVIAVLGQGWVLRGDFLADDWGLVATLTDAGEPDFGLGLRQFAQPVPGVEAPLPASMYPKFWRPLWRVSFLTDLAVWGPRPFGFLLTNLLLHAGGCVLLALLALRLGLSGPGAIAAGALFALHPTHHEAVGWIAARGGLLATAGVLGCAVLGLDARRRPALSLAAAGAMLLGLLAKESAVVAPALLAVCLAVAPRDASGSRRWSVLAAPAAAFGIWLLARRAVLGVWTGGYGISGFAPGSAQMWRGWMERLQVLSGPGKEALIAPSINTLLRVVVLAAVLWGAARAARQRGARPAFVVGLAWLALAFVPVWQFVVDPQIQQEARFLYPAAGALALVLAASLDGPRARLGATALGLAWIGLTVVNSAHRRAAWELNEVLVEQTREVVWTAPVGTQILLIGLPDQVGGAYVGRNAVPGMLDPPFDVRVLPTRPLAYTTREGELQRFRADLARIPAEQARMVLGWAPKLRRYRWVQTP